MMIDREVARIARDFREADRIRDILRDKGIEIYDRERKWEAKDGRVGPRPNHDDPKRNGGGGGGGGGGNRDRSRDRDAPRSRSRD